MNVADLLGEILIGLFETLFDLFGEAFLEFCLERVSASLYAAVEGIEPATFIRIPFPSSDM